MKKIKLGNLLEYIDPICSLVIWTPDDKKAPAYEGAAMDTPWYLTKMYLEDPKKNAMDGTIDARLIEKNHNSAIMVIVLAAEEE